MLDDSADAPQAKRDRAETAVVTAVLTRGPDDSFQTYLLASKQAPSGTLDLSTALELPDTLVAQNDEAIFIGDNERLTFQRYEVNDDYSFSMVGEFSLQPFGVTYINNPPLFFSSTTAYYVDAPAGQIIEFDPTEMEVTEVIEVPELLRENYVTWLGPAHRVGDRYLASVLYTNEDWTAAPPDSTVGIIIQEDRSEPIRLLRDERGVGAYLSFIDDRGDFYFGAGGSKSTTSRSGFSDPPLVLSDTGACNLDGTFTLNHRLVRIGLVTRRLAAEFRPNDRSDYLTFTNELGGRDVPPARDNPSVVIALANPFTRTDSIPHQCLFQVPEYR